MSNIRVKSTNVKNTKQIREQMENISLAKSVLGARFSGEKDLRLVKKKTVFPIGKTKLWEKKTPSSRENQRGA